MATPETPGAVRRLAHVTYDDGHTETLNLSKPRILYETTNLEGAIDTPGKLLYLQTWIAAGKPGLNGNVAALTGTVAVEKMEAWIYSDEVEAIEFAEEPITGPPTKPPGRSRASRGSSGAK